MAAGIGALLGLATGGVLGYAGQNMKVKNEQKQALQQYEWQSFLDEAHTNPAVMDNPEFVKHGKKLFGDQWEMISPTLQAHSAEYKRSQALFQSILSGGAPQQQPMGAPTAQGPTNPAAFKLPAQQSAQGAQPTAGSQPQGQAPSQPQNEIAGLQDQTDRLTMALSTPGLQPEQRAAISGMVKNLNERIHQTETMAYQAENLADRQQARADSNLLKMMNLQMMNAMREASLQETKLQHDFMDSLATEKNDEARQTQFNNVVGSLTKQSQHIEDMVRSATPPDPATLDSAIKDYNQNLRRAKQIGTRYKYDTTLLPDPKKRGATPPAFMGMGGGKPTVETDAGPDASADTSKNLGALEGTPPVAGAVRSTYRGKPGWFDSKTSHFYPDA
jgi:hypothetical protein